MSSAGAARPTALSGALLATAAMLVVLASLTDDRWLVLGAGAVAGLLVAGRLARPDLSAVAVCLDGDGRARAGEPFATSVHVHNHGRRPLPALRLQVIWAGAVGPVTVDVEPVPPGGVARAASPVLALRRGVHEGAHATVTVADPLGLVEVTRAWAASRRLVVHPAACPPGHPVLCAGSATGPAVRSGRDGDDVAGLRPFRDGDERRDVHWRASARRRRLVVVERDLPDRPRRWVLAVVGAPATPGDEHDLALAAATWLHQRSQGVDVTALAWLPGGGLLTGPDGTPTAVLDWCAGLGDLATPSPVQLLEALPAGADGVTVLAPAHLGSGYVADLRTHLAGRGVQVTGTIMRDAEAADGAGR